MSLPPAAAHKEQSLDIVDQCDIARDCHNWADSFKENTCPFIS